MTSFSYDYGTLPDYIKISAIPSNLTECIWCDALSDLMGICLKKKREQVNAMSDYEKFRALCNHAHHLKGHPAVLRVEHLLSSICNMPIKLSGDFCDELWDIGATKLSRCNTSIGQLLTDTQVPRLKRIRCAGSELDIVRSLGITPLLDGNAFLQTEKKNRNDWEQEMKRTLEQFINAGCDGVALSLSKAYRDVSPDPYHVNQALSQKERTAEDESMLLAQVFRFLSMECAAGGLFMVLRLEGTAKQSMAFLSRIEKVGRLPKTVLTVSDLAAASEVINFCVGKSVNGLECGLQTSNHPSEAELSFAVTFYAARYPLGRLHFFTGTDLRYTCYEMQRIEKTPLN